MATPCIEDLVCNNGEFMAGEEKAKCALCRLSPDNIGRDMAHYWSPTPPARKGGCKNSVLEAEKRKAKVDKRLLKLVHKRGRDQGKIKISRLAQQAEAKTEKKIIHATKNSGRQNKDGDHVSIGRVTLDTKLQTTRSNPLIMMSELEKVCNDAKRAGNITGGLVIRNKNNVGCVVLTESGFAKFLGLFRELEERLDE